MTVKKKIHINGQEFAELGEYSYSSVKRWLQKGLITGATLQKLGSLKEWKIPIDALKSFAPPQKGRPRKSKSKKKAA